jgi:regulator of cell morphogenesis and NO signaling
MQFSENTTVRDIAADSLEAVRVFEKLGIDYCCGGKRPLAAVCREKGLDAASVQKELNDAMAAPAIEQRNWATARLSELITHIIDTHHEYLRRELPTIQTRLDKVYRVYNQRYGPTLIGLPEAYAALRNELEMHIRKEEAILFPAIAAYETAADAGASLPFMRFGTMSNPIHMMEQEHEHAGRVLEQIRAITRNFEVPEYACVTYRALMGGLKELERDLHTHIHLENNVLFPRTEKLEKSKSEMWTRDGYGCMRAENTSKLI